METAMNSSRLFLLALILSLAGCAAPKAQIPPSPAGTSLLPSLAESASWTATPTPTTSLPIAPSKTATLESSPTSTPRPTAIPTLTSLNIDTAPAFQIIRDSTYAGVESMSFSQAISPNTGQVAFAGCENGTSDSCTISTFRLIDAETGQVIRDLESLSPVIEVLKFSPDGKYLAAAGCNITPALYLQPETVCDQPRTWVVDTTTGKMLFEMKGYTSHLYNLVFSPDGKSLFTSVILFRSAGMGDSFIHIYSVPDGAVLDTLYPPIGAATRMYFMIDISPDGRYLVTDARMQMNSKDSYVEWWDVLDPAHPHQVAVIDHSFLHTISPDSSQIIIQNPEDYSLRRYSLDSGALIGTLSPPKEAGLDGFKYISPFQYVNDSNTLLLNDGSAIYIISVADGTMIKNIPVDYLASYVLSPDRHLLLTAGYTFPYGLDVSKSFILWDTSTWQAVPVMSSGKDNLDFASTAFNFAINSDQTRFFVVSDFTYAKNIVIWGFPQVAQQEAEKTLIQFFDLLAKGNYAQAIALTNWNQAFIDWLNTNFSGFFSGTDLVADLQKACTDPLFPCRPIRDVLYRSEVAPGQYTFVVDFLGEDGNVEPCQSCKNDPTMFMYSNAMFRYGIFQKADGSFVLFDGLPPALLLHQQ